MSDLTERLGALADTLWYSIRDDCANAYTLNLSEMYLIIDGIEAQAEEIERLRRVVQAYHDNHNQQSEPLCVCRACILAREAAESAITEGNRLIAEACGYTTHMDEAEERLVWVSPGGTHSWDPPNYHIDVNAALAAVAEICPYFTLRYAPADKLWRCNGYKGTLSVNKSANAPAAAVFAMVVAFLQKLKGGE